MAEKPENPRDPREVLQELRSFVLQQAVHDQSQQSMCHEQRQARPHIPPPQPFNDPLTVLYRAIHDEWCAFQSLIDEQNFRLVDDTIRNDVRQHLELLNQNFDPLALIDEQNTDPVQTISPVEKIKNLVKKILLWFLKPVLIKQQLFNSEVVRFGNSLMEVLDSFTHQQRHYNDHQLKVGDRLMKLVTAVQKARDQLKRQLDLQYSLSDEFIKSAFNDIFEDLANLRNDIKSTQQSWEKRNQERMITLQTSLLSHKETIQDFVKRLEKDHKKITLSAREKEDLVAIDSQRSSLFEDEHRGSSVDIKQRQLLYLDFF